MESDRFDELAARLATPLSRRNMGLLCLLGLGGAVTLDETHAKRKKKKKKGKKPTTTPPPGCTPRCDSRTCGDDGCGGSCGACTGDLVCRNGACDCPEGKELCGGQCYPVCVPTHPSQAVGRHPVRNCNCCVRPGSYPCPDALVQCCQGPEDLPCCGHSCNPAAVRQVCPEGFDPEGTGICHYDVECHPQSRCPEGIDPRRCELIPT